MHSGFKHHMDSGRLFNDAKDSDASSPRNLTLNRFEVCDRLYSHNGVDGCDSRNDAFYGYPRWCQPNGTSMEQVWDQYGEQFRNSRCKHCVNTLGQHHVNTLGWGADNIGIIRMCSGRHRSVVEGILPQVNRGPARQIDVQYGSWIVYEKWAGNRPRILGRCRQTQAKQLGSAPVGLPEVSAWYVICDNRLERPAVAIVATNPWSL